MLGPVLGAGGTAVNEALSLPPQRLPLNTHTQRAILPEQRTVVITLLAKAEWS